MTKTQKVNKLNKALSKIELKGLQNWLNYASEIHPSMKTALEGIYCGREGRIHVPLDDFYTGCYLTMGWYCVSSDPRVEYAYVS